MRGYSPADSADDAEECSKLHYPAEKDRLFEVVAVVAVLLFWLLSAIISVICGRHLGFIVLIDRVLLHGYSPADSADSAEEYSKLHYFAEKD